MKKYQAPKVKIKATSSDKKTAKAEYGMRM